ncbi:MAG: protease modulator HflC [Candidatus Omnitrophica bacterium]|nr:protease modulator HflC [Candidatus Omnitrophota bacterium]
MKPKLILTIAVALLIVVCFTLFLTSFTLRVTECAVVLRWENPTYALVGTVKDQAGLHWKLPWPIDKVEKFDARVNVFSTKFEETFTRDGYTLVVNASTGWRIASPIKFREKVGTVAKAQEHLTGLVRTYKNAVIGKHPLAHLISTDPETLQFDNIENEMLANIGREAEDKYGLIVEFTKIKQINLPPAVTEAVFNRMRKERERIAVDIRETGEKEAKKIRVDADAQRDEILASAQAEARLIMGQGDAEAAKYYEVFAENEELAIFLRKIDAFKTTLKKRATVILTTDDEPYDLFEKGWKQEKK